MGNKNKSKHLQIKPLLIPTVPENLSCSLSESQLSDSRYLWRFLNEAIILSWPYYEGTYDLKAVSSNHLKYFGNLFSHRCYHGK